MPLTRAFREQLNNCEMSKGSPEGSLEAGRSGVVVQAEAAAWAQPRRREASWKMLAGGPVGMQAWGSVSQTGGVGAGSGV